MSGTFEDEIKAARQRFQISETQGDADAAWAKAALERLLTTEIKRLWNVVEAPSIFTGDPNVQKFVDLVAEREQLLMPKLKPMRSKPPEQVSHKEVMRMKSQLAETDRVEAIVCSPAAAGWPEYARSLAYETDLPAYHAIEMLSRARAKTPAPVSVADPWSSIIDRLNNEMAAAVPNFIVPKNHESAP